MGVICTFRHCFQDAFRKPFCLLYLAFLIPSVEILASLYHLQLHATSPSFFIERWPIHYYILEFYLPLTTDLWLTEVCVLLFRTWMLASPLSLVDWSSFTLEFFIWFWISISPLARYSQGAQPEFQRGKKKVHNGNRICSKWVTVTFAGQAQCFSEHSSTVDWFCLPLGCSCYCSPSIKENKNQCHERSKICWEI